MSSLTWYFTLVWAWYQFQLWRAITPLFYILHHKSCLKYFRRSMWKCEKHGSVYIGSATDALFIHWTRFITTSHFGGSPNKYINRVEPKPNISSYFQFVLFFTFRETFHWLAGSVRGFQFAEWRNIGYILGHSRSPQYFDYSSFYTL